MRQLRISKLITNRETTSLDKYLQDISREKLITAEEEVELARRIKSGDEKALDKLVKANLRFVVSVAKQYQNQGLSLPDLIGEGNFGLIKAAQRFDETRGFKFISYAVWWIRQSIIYSIMTTKTIRLPLNQVGTLNKIKKATSRLEQEFERPPSVEEIALKLDIPEHNLDKALRTRIRYVSVDTPIAEDEDTKFLDVFVSDDTPRTDNNLMSESLNKEIQRSLSTLSQKERDVINLYYGIGMNHGLTLDEIADIFGLSREYIGCIKKRAINRLKRHSRNLKQFLE